MKFMGKIRAIAFDFDDTLVDEEYAVLDRWKKTLPKYSFLSADGLLEEEFMKVYFEKGRYYPSHVNDTLARLKIDQRWCRNIVEYFLQSIGEERLNDGVKETLVYLKQKGIQLGIVTNGLRKTHEKRIRNSGISEFIEMVVYGDDLKKPASAGFLSLLKGMNLSSVDELLVVGNDLTEDISGARSIGAKACWITSKAELIDDPDVITLPSMREFHAFITRGLQKVKGSHE